MSVDEIYKRLSNQNSSFNTKQIENSIAYAINIRNANTSKTNFKKIFGYEYDIYCFTNKNLIEELVRIIKNSPDKGWEMVCIAGHFLGKKVAL